MKERTASFSANVRNRTVSQCCVKYVMATATAAACISPPLLLPLLPLPSLLLPTAVGMMTGEVRLREALSLPSNRCLRAWRLGVPTNNNRSNRPGRVTATEGGQRGRGMEGMKDWRMCGGVVSKDIYSLLLARTGSCMKIRYIFWQTRGSLSSQGMIIQGGKFNKPASKDRSRLVATIKIHACCLRRSLSWVSMAVVSMRLSIPRLGFSRSRQNSSISSNKMMVMVIMEVVVIVMMVVSGG